MSAAAAVCGGSPVLPSSTVDPATNDAPLEFAARIKTTVAPEGLGRPVGATFGSFAAGLAEGAAGLPSLASLMGSPAPWGVPPFIGLPGDPALMGVVSSYSQCPQFSFLGPPPEIGPGILPASVLSPNAPVKELLRFPNCVLYPPNQICHHQPQESDPRAAARCLWVACPRAQQRNWFERCSSTVAPSLQFA